MLFKYANQIIQRYILLRHNVTYSHVSYLHVWNKVTCCADRLVQWYEQTQVMSTNHMYKIHEIHKFSSSNLYLQLRHIKIRTNLLSVQV